MHAGACYLHDKKGSTNERVAFTLTMNLPTNDHEFDSDTLKHIAAELDSRDHMGKANSRRAQ